MRLGPVIPQFVCGYSPDASLDVCRDAPVAHIAWGEAWGAMCATGASCLMHLQFALNDAYDAHMVDEHCHRNGRGTWWMNPRGIRGQSWCEYPDATNALWEQILTEPDMWPQYEPPNDCQHERTVAFVVLCDPRRWLTCQDCGAKWTEPRE